MLLAASMKAYPFGMPMNQFRKANFEPFDEAPILSRSGHTMGVIDVKFNDKGTKVAVSSLDSIIRVWDVATSNKSQSFR